MIGEKCTKKYGYGDKCSNKFKFDEKRINKLNLVKNAPYL